MLNKEIFYIQDYFDISENNYKTINACLSDFKTWDSDESALCDGLQYLLNNESIGLEMSSITSGRGITLENLNDQFYIDTLKKMKTNQVIIFNYNKRYIVVFEKLGIKIITDWCAENTTNPAIPTLCEQLKQKYEVE